MNAEESAAPGGGGGFEWIAPRDCERIDRLLAELHGEFSRARWQKLIESGTAVTVNGRPVGDRAERVRAGDVIRCTVPEAPRQGLAAQEIPLEILHEDAEVLVLAKPPGLVVHPAPGHEEGTLANALMHHLGADFGRLDAEDRPGIVHRLDRDTSGVMVVGKTAEAMRSLKEQFAAHSVLKEYLALVWGAPVPARGVYEWPLGRHPAARKKMAVRNDGRPARTLHTTLLAGPGASLQRVRIETGRTHQIRVHFAHAGHPVCGDGVYGRARAGVVPGLLPRQMLHACRLRFVHPRSGKEAEFVLPPPGDFLAAADALLGAPSGGKGGDAGPLREAWERNLAALFPWAAREKDFPMIGNFFSTHWKTAEKFFHSLENAPAAGADPAEAGPEVRR